MKSWTVAHTRTGELMADKGAGDGSVVTSLSTQDPEPMSGGPQPPVTPGPGDQHPLRVSSGTHTHVAPTQSRIRTHK